MTPHNCVNGVVNVEVTWPNTEPMPGTKMLCPVCHPGDCSLCGHPMTEHAWLGRCTFCADRSSPDRGFATPDGGACA